MKGPEILKRLMKVYGPDVVATLIYECIVHPFYSLDLARIDFDLLLEFKKFWEEGFLELKKK